MEQQANTGKTTPIIDFGRIWAAVKKHRSLYFKVIPAVFFGVWIISLGIPNYYKCQVVLAPEEGAYGNTSSLAALASSFGINVNGDQGSAITVLFYPDLLNSNDFKTSLFNIKVQRKEDASPMTYFSYLRDQQKQPWWIDAKDGLLEMVFGKSPKKNDLDSINLFELTSEQTYISALINQKITCNIGPSVAKQGTLITVEVTDQDPYVAATMADSVKVHLQNFIIDYRTKKARRDLEFTEKLYKESKRNYERSRQLYADFMDQNHDLILENVRQKQTELENEMQLYYNHYNAISNQLLTSRVRVQEKTPVFTPIQSATVPLIKSGPNRNRIIIVFVIVSIIFTTIWVLYKEDEIRPLLGLSNN